MFARAIFIALLTAATVGLAIASGVFPPGTAAVTIGQGYRFTEGPCWRTAGYLVFSDINGNAVHRWMPAQGCSLLLTPSGNTNGIAEDPQGRLILAQQGERRVVRIETDGSQTVLADAYNGKQLNSPNDLAVRPDGTVYFTDPPYGVRPAQEQLGFYGVYRVGPSAAQPLLLLDSLKRPNGLALSPDQTILYIGDTDAARVIAATVLPSGDLSRVHLFATLGTPRNVDGLDVDRDGNLYCAGTQGWIWVLSPQGALIDSLAVPEKTTNVQWGGAEGKTLFITSGTSLYSASVGTGVAEGSQRDTRGGASPSPALTRRLALHRAAVPVVAAEAGPAITPAGRAAATRAGGKY